MPLLSSKSEGNLLLLSFVMHRILKPSHHNDSDSSYSIPKGKSVDPDDDPDPDNVLSYASSSLNGAKKPATVTTKENKVDNAKATPKATKENSCGMK